MGGASAGSALMLHYSYFVKEFFRVLDHASRLELG
jgi:hypothetical protein